MVEFFQCLDIDKIKDSEAYRQISLHEESFEQLKKLLYLGSFQSDSTINAILEIYTKLYEELINYFGVKSINKNISKKDSTGLADLIGWRKRCLELIKREGLKDRKLIFTVLYGPKQLVEGLKPENVASNRSVVSGSREIYYYGNSLFVNNLRAR
jgi:hypothetical protein